jgi:hypothetical protein
LRFFGVFEFHGVLLAAWRHPRRSTAPCPRRAAVGVCHLDERRVESSGTPVGEIMKQCDVLDTPNGCARSDGAPRL